jgi:deazaflavin-dependent oxidoreductase (nitroreductase family)
VTATRPEWAAESFCYLTTTGRRTGRPHEIEIWFAEHDGRLYLLAGGGRRADWVRNLIREPDVELGVGSRSGPGVATVVEDEDLDALARRLLAAKYQGWREGAELSEWARTALPVEIRWAGGDPPAGEGAGPANA